MLLNGLLPLIVLAAPLLSVRNPDSLAVCAADSRESVFARSLSKSQLEALHADSMKLLARTDLLRTYRNRAGYPPIPAQFVYLNPGKIDTFVSEVEGVDSYVSFVLKGCMDEFIELSVTKGDIVLSYGLGGASHVGEEFLWSWSRQWASE